jgi:FMN phosphatase YigB (HAD superfamily)
VKQRIAVLITDLDNTLYDWVTFFSCAFYDMVEVAARLLSVTETVLLDQLKQVHQRFHSSEHPYALLDTEIVRERFGNLTRTQQAQALDDAFHAFNRKRNDSLKLYEGVKETLDQIRRQGTTIIGHTEATVPSAVFRLRKLDIESKFDRLYAATPQGAELPFAARDAILHNTPVEIHSLPPFEKKPNPRVLKDICLEVPVDEIDALYVGDSISRDIGMAKAAGVWAAWAKYGTDYEPIHWDRLVRITHWTDDDVQRAKKAAEIYGHARPDVTLQSFSELLNHFEFTPIPKGQKYAEWSRSD